jgi:D-glycero-alpha-D-manno-heptose 1-phosphate guanylyltransferase
MQTFNCLILCGGQGTRIREYNSDTPKSLLEVGGKRFLDHLLLQFKEFNITLCTGYLSNHFENLFSNSHTINISREKEPLGTGGAIINALNHIDNCDVFLVINGDSYCNFKINNFVNSFITEKCDLMILATDNYDNHSDFGMMEIIDKRIVNFHEKSSQKVKGSLKNCGIYMIKKELLKAFNHNCSLEKDIIPSLVQNHHCLIHKISEKVYDIGTPERIAIANEYFNNQNRT